jgi:hypothetical protein
LFFSSFLDDQAHHLHLTQVFRACGCRVDARGVDAGVPQDVCQLGNVLLHIVKRAREQVTQVMRKYLARQHVRLFTQRFHHAPHVMSADRLAFAGSKNAACFDFVGFGITRELVHYQRFAEALNKTREGLDSKNYYATNPSFDK